MSNSKLELLQGWKNIAAYVDRDVSTVKRWERSRGLPVRRMPGEGRANVYAHAAELSQWLSGKEGACPDEEAAAFALEVGPAKMAPALADAEQSSISPRSGFRRHLITRAGLAAVLCGAILSCLAYYRIPRVSGSGRPSIQTAYISPFPGVQETYLRGQYLYEQRTPDTMRLALDCFRDATTRDPADAEAWAGLADAYLLQHEYGVMTLDEAYPAMKAAANRALSLQPSMSEPHSTLGFAEFFWMTEIPAAELEFKTAIQLDPSSSTAHSRYGAMLTYQARFPEALMHLNLAQQLDPKSTAVLANRAFALGLGGHRDEAVSLLKQVGYNDRNASVLHHLGVLSEVEPRNLPVYLEQFRRLSEFRHDKYGRHMYEQAERTFRASGETPMWRALLASTERVTPQPNTVTLDLPRYEAFLGENDKALADLEVIARAHKAGLIGILIDPAFLSLHHDPRFARLVAEIGLPPTFDTAPLPAPQ